VSIPAGELYWGVLAPSSLPRGSQPGDQVVEATDELDELFAELLPVEIGVVKTAYAPIDATRILAVAVQRDRLVGVVGDGTTVVMPGSVPSAVLTGPHSADLCASLNLLWGDLEAKPVVRAKRRAAATALAVILFVTVVAVIGLERRTSALRSAADQHQIQAAGALKDLYHKPTTEASLAALDLDLSRLVRTRAPRTGLSSDASDALQALLTAWPRGNERKTNKLRTESLTATPDTLTLTVALDDRVAATPLSDSLRTIPGWKLFQPQFTAAAGGGNGAPSSSTASSGGMLSLRLSVDAAGATKPEHQDAGGDR
jgi:hypothetical protein